MLFTEEISTSKGLALKTKQAEEENGDSDDSAEELSLITKKIGKMLRERSVRHLQSKGRKS